MGIVILLVILGLFVYLIYRTIKGLINFYRNLKTGTHYLTNASNHPSNSMNYTRPAYTQTIINNPNATFFGNPNPQIVFSKHTYDNENTMNKIYDLWTYNKAMRFIMSCGLILVGFIITFSLIVPSYHILNKIDGGNHNFMALAKQHESNNHDNSDSHDNNDNNNLATSNKMNANINSNSSRYESQYNNALKQPNDWNVKAVHPNHQDYVKEDPDLSYMKQYSGLNSHVIKNSHSNAIAMGMYKRMQGDYESQNQLMSIHGHNIFIRNKKNPNNTDHTKMYITGVYLNSKAGLVLQGRQIFYWNQKDSAKENINDSLIANQQNSGVEYVNDDVVMGNINSSYHIEPNTHLASSLLIDSPEDDAYKKINH